MMKHIITLSGDIGSGKSSVAACLATKTGYEIVGTGKIQRAIAEKHGMTTLELNEKSETDRSVDDEIDSFVINMGKTRDNLIVDSRLAWHFIPEAYKVYLSVAPGVGAERVYNALRKDENNVSLELTLANNLNRQSLEVARFKKLYAVNFRDQANYDLVVDTSLSDPEEVASDIFSGFSYWLNEKQ